MPAEAAVRIMEECKGVMKAMVDRFAGMAHIHLRAYAATPILLGP
jgi:hypothetical protein